MTIDPFDAYHESDDTEDSENTEDWQLDCPNEQGIYSPEALLELKKYWMMRALNLLVRREHSEYEFRQKLKLKACPLALIDGILTYCKDQKYLNETRFAEAFAQSKANKGFGPNRVRYELQQHRISATDIELALELTDWQAAKVVALRKCAGKDPQKLRNALFQRGFAE